MSQSTLAIPDPNSILVGPICANQTNEDWYEAALQTSVGLLENNQIGGKSKAIRNSWGDDDEDADDDVPDEDLPAEEEEDEPDPFEDFDEEDFDDDFDDDFEEELEDEYEIEPADDGMLEGHPDAEDIDDVDGDSPAIEFTDDE